jgi:hypothetical protein
MYTTTEPSDKDEGGRRCDKKTGTAAPARAKLRPALSPLVDQNNAADVAGRDPVGAVTGVAIK